MANAVKFKLGTTVTHRHSDASGRVIGVGRDLVKVERFVYDGADGKVRRVEIWKTSEVK